MKKPQPANNRSDTTPTRFLRKRRLSLTPDEIKAVSLVVILLMLGALVRLLRMKTPWKTSVCRRGKHSLG